MRGKLCLAAPTWYSKVAIGKVFFWILVSSHTASVLGIFGFFFVLFQITDRSLNFLCLFFTFFSITMECFVFLHFFFLTFGSEHSQSVSDFST